MQRVRLIRKGANQGRLAIVESTVVKHSDAGEEVQYNLRFNERETTTAAADEVEPA